jgi:glutathione synthase/RimK-type ligase-like ATP-grasp enzyme
MTDGPHASDEAVADQWRAFLSALATIPGPVWVSDPSAIHRAENKARQLALAVDVGLDVPDTLWTTDVEQAAAFIGAVGSEAVVKSVASAWWEENGKGQFVFARSVTVGDLPDQSRLAAAPVCLQRRIWPKRDVRVTVVGANCFAAVHEPADEAPMLDWRLGDQSGWAPYELPHRVALACARLTHDLGLAFAGIDFVVDEADHLWFLELNPNGEWGWLQRSGLPIAEAIADLLTEQR